MKKFFKDYWELCKHSLRFCKKHWFGMTVLTIVCMAVSFMPFAVLEIREKIEMKKLRRSNGENDG